MSAKEMFEELNYFQSSEDFEDELVYNLNTTDVESYRYISFHKIFKYIEVDDWTGNFQLSVQELKAINKQIEELHWNDTIVNFDVKLDGKKVIEAMRSGNRKDLGGIYER